VESEEFVMVDKQSAIQAAYRQLRKLSKEDMQSEATGDLIVNLVAQSVGFSSSESNLVGLESEVSGKRYFSYERGGVVARPVNRALFMEDEREIRSLWKEIFSGLESRIAIGQESIEKSLYTIALAPCLVMELLDRQNKKGPATYFEILIGHIFSRFLHQNPIKKATLPILGENIRLTMDFLFETDDRKIHLPVKMSTRERVVQAWAHQRLLDSAYQAGSYDGIMVLFSETKLNSRTREVVEICVPDQWKIYQSLLAKMRVVYYFDIPVRYQQLTNEFPHVIDIRPFSEFFTEREIFGA